MAGPYRSIAAAAIIAESACTSAQAIRACPPLPAQTKCCAAQETTEKRRFVLPNWLAASIEVEEYSAIGKAACSCCSCEEIGAPG